MKVQKNSDRFLYYILCAAIGVVALFPVSCNYIMSGGIVGEWIARTEGIAAGLRAGRLELFPPAEVLAGIGAMANGMNSNLWFFFPGFLYHLSGNIVLAYRFYMLAVQIGTLLASIWFFEGIFAGRGTRRPAFFGTLLYMTCPYRIYVCYDWASLSQAAAWMLLPLYAGAVSRLTGGGRKEEIAGRGAGIRRLTDAVIAALALAGIGYADVVFFVTAAGMALAAGLALRRFWPCVSVAAGAAVFWPGLSRLLAYLFADGLQELGLPLDSIMPKGYRLGQYFGAYAFRDGHPGMGLGMLVCLLTAVWLGFVWKQGETQGICRLFAGMSVLFLLFSFYYFPWDLVQRLGIWSLKLVSLIGTPAVFWGMAFFCLCVPAASAVDRAGRHEDSLAASAVPVIVLLACIGICVYQCNTLTYSRPPLGIL